jgi:hypothetical protein
VVWAAALVAVALLFAPVQALTVRPGRGAGLYWALLARPGQEFTLAWTHTVSRSPVTETYTIDTDSRLSLREMVFDQYGPNLPAGPEGGTVWRIERDRWVVTGYQYHLDRLNLGVGPYDHHLRMGGRDFDLVAGVGPDRLVRVTAEREPLLFIILTEVWQWRNTSSPP